MWIPENNRTKFAGREFLERDKSLFSLLDSSSREGGVGVPATCNKS